MNYSRFFLSLFLMFLSFPDVLWSQNVMTHAVRRDNLASIDRYRSRSNGNWNTPSTWEISTDNGKTWRAATSTTPASGSAVCTIVTSGHTVTVTQSVAIDSTVIDGQVTINSGQTLTIANAPGTDLTVNGTLLNQGTFSVNTGATWVLNGGAAFIHNSSSGISTALNAGTISPSSTFEYRDSGTPSLGGRTYGNLKLASVSSKTYTNSASSGSLTVCGLLEIGKGVTWSTGGFEIDITVQGSTIVNGIWTGSGSTNQGTHTFNGAFTVSSSGSYSLATSGAIHGNLNFKGDLIVYGSLTTPTNRSVNFSGANPQTIGGGSTISFGNGLVAVQNLTVGAGATVQIAAGKVMKVLKDLTVLGSISAPGSISFEGDSKTLVNNDSITASAVFASGAATIAGTGIWSSLTITSGCAATIEGVHTLIGSGTPLVVSQTTALKSNSTIIYRGSSSQTIAPVPYGDLEIDNPAGISLFSTASISGVLTLRKGVFSSGLNLTLAPSASIVRETGSLTGTPNFGPQINVTYVGSVEVKTGPEIPRDASALMDLTISNSGGVTLGTGATANGTVGVIGGNLITGTNALTLGASATIIETDPYSVVGQLRATRTLTAGKKETFGGLGIEINAGGAAPGLTTVSRVTGSASTLAGGISLLRYFDITPALDSALAATLVFHYSTCDLNGISAANLKLFKSTDGGLSWITVGSVVDVPSKSVTVEEVNSLSRWTAGEPFPVPTLANVNPSFGEPGSSLTIELKGTGFVRGVSALSFGGTGISVNSFAVSSSTCIVATIAISSLATPGYRNVSVTNAGAGTAMLPVAFQVRLHLNPVPSVASVEPSSGVRGQSLNVTLRGRGFVAGSTTLSFGDSVQVKSSAITADTGLAATIFISSGAALGVRNIMAVNPAPGGGTSSLLDAFTVANPPPALSGLSRTSGARGLSFWMTILGTNFVRDTSRVNFGDGISIDTIFVPSSTMLSIKVTVESDAIPGPRDVTVMNTSPGGGVATLIAAFLVTNPVPTLSAVSPDSGWLGQSIHVVLTGSNYLEKVSTVSFGDGITLDSISVSTRDRIQARLSIVATTAAGLRDVSVTNSPPGGGTATLKSGFRVLNLQPTISSVTPTSALSGESLTVTIQGTNFIQGQTKVSLGQGIAVNSVMVDNPRQLRVAIAISPMTAGGPRDIEVTIPSPGGGSASLAAVFLVQNPAPTLRGLSATSGQRGKTMGFLVNGSGFIPGATTMSFGLGIVVNSLAVSNPNQMFVDISVARDASLGLRDICVVNAAPGGGVATLPAYFAVVNPFPSLANVSPSSGIPGQTMRVILGGSDLLDSVSTVSFGDGITVNTANTNSAGTQITAGITITATATPGARNVTVTNAAPGGGTASLTGGFIITSPMPTLTGVAPASGARGQTMTVVLTGSSFFEGLTSVSFGTSVIVNSSTVTSPTQMNVSITIAYDATLGLRDVVVTNPEPGGGSAMLKGVFAVNNPAPAIVSTSFTSGYRGKTYNLLVQGTNFVSEATTLNLGEGIVVHSVTIGNPSQLFAYLSIERNAIPGSRDVVVMNSGPGGGTSVIPGGFTVQNPPPNLRAITPSAGILGQILVLEMSGSDFFDGVTTISIGNGISVKSMAIDSGGTQITAHIAIDLTAAAGPRNVVIVNSGPEGGIATLADAFEVKSPEPMLTRLNPLGGARGQTLDVSIMGSGFVGSSTQVSFGLGVSVNSKSVVSQTEMVVNISIATDAAFGPRNVVITNSPPGGGTMTLSNAFTIANPAPSLLSISPTSGIRGQTLDIVLVGANFLTDITSASFGDGVTVNSLSVNSFNQATTNLSIASDATPGSRNATITNSPPGGGSATLAASFIVTNPSPAFLGIAPLVGYRGLSVAVTIVGQNFFDGMTTVDFGPNILVNSCKVITAARLSSTIVIEPCAALGARNVTVKNAAPGGGGALLTNAFTICNPAPTLTGLNPGVGMRGQSLSVSLNGSNFIAGTTTINFGTSVTLDAFDVPGLSEANAHISIPVSSAPGVRDVSICNPPPGGGTATLSGAFFIVNPAPTIVRVTPGRAAPGSHLNVTVNGTQFFSGVTNLSFGADLAVTNLTVNSPTMLQADISVDPSAARGPRPVVVTNAGPGGGSANLPDGFIIDSEPLTVVERALGTIPDHYTLSEAYPNPFNASVRIHCGLPEDSKVILNTYSVLGNLVAQLVNGQRSKGSYELQWSADNLPSGVYFVRLVAESTESTKRYTSSRKVILMK